MLDKDKIKFEEISKSPAKSQLPENPEYIFSINFDNRKITDIEEIDKIIKQLLEKQITSEIIDRLKNDNELNEWIKEGYDIHRSRDEKEKCLFCQNQFERNFLITLSKHFNRDYEESQRNILIFIEQLKKNNIKKVLDQINSLYPDLIEKYQLQVNILNDSIEKLNKWIDAAILILEKKKQKPVFKDVFFIRK